MARFTIKMEYDDKENYHDTEINIKIEDDYSIDEIHALTKNAIACLGFAEQAIEDYFG